MNVSARSYLIAGVAVAAGAGGIAFSPIASEPPATYEVRPAATAIEYGLIACLLSGACTGTPPVVVIPPGVPPVVVPPVVPPGQTPGGGLNGGGTGIPDPVPPPNSDPDPVALPAPVPRQDVPLSVGEVIGGELRSGARVASEVVGAGSDVVRAVRRAPSRVRSDLAEGVALPEAIGRATNEVVLAVGTATNRVMIAANGYIRPRMELIGVTTKAAIDVAGAVVAAGGAVATAVVVSAADVATAPLRGEAVSTAVDRSVGRVSESVTTARRTITETTTKAGDDITRAVRVAQAGPREAASASESPSASGAAS